MTWNGTLFDVLLIAQKNSQRWCCRKYETYKECYTGGTARPGKYKTHVCCWRGWYSFKLLDLIHLIFDMFKTFWLDTFYQKCLPAFFSNIVD